MDDVKAPPKPAAPQNVAVDAVIPRQDISRPASPPAQPPEKPAQQSSPLPLTTPKPPPLIPVLPIFLAIVIAGAMIAIAVFLALKDQT